MIHSAKLKGMGALIALHGGNNLWEATAPLLIENQHIGPIRSIYHCFLNILVN
ncbi:DUF4225 domain-containing protein [Serratia microhaemolytica]|uniref:DUF4225 domain-containing protein n=1 Tax=Serratia microhaemolytica TaxID=2675110 RepID=UPI000FDEDCD2